MSKAPVVEVRSLSVAVPSRSRLPFLHKPTLDILADVSLTIGAGEIVCMVGESGSGKSTFGRALVGLMRPSGGELLLDGEPLDMGLHQGKSKMRAAAALLFQDPVTSFNPRQRIGAIIAEPRRIAGQGSTKADAIAALAQQAGLDRGFLGRFPHGLSGGQARRAAVARALSVVPRLIVADEPTAGLDLSVQGGVLNLFLDIRDEHDTAFLIITHNLAVARHVSDRIAILYLGRVVESGRTADIFRAPRHPYTAALLASEPLPDPARRRTVPPVIGEVPSLANRPSGCEFHTRCRLVQPRCRTERPESQPISPGHLLSCHYPLEAEMAETSA